ncbi:MAG: LysR family transcriptional regulator [Chloroflexi bacterium]|nr:LysR family transcriptional regulator [Chloroflexota bacterium]
MPELPAARPPSVHPTAAPNPAAGSRLNFHQLYIFHTVASQGGFSKAAAFLDITQPAVSIQVQELERSMGVTLFHRRPRHLTLTDVGETVYAYSQQIFSLSDKLLDTVEEMEDLKVGRLTLGASTTPGEYVLPLALGRFRQLYPGIQTELVIANTRTIIQRLLNREIDLGMVGERPEEHSGELEMVHYMDDEIVMVAAPNHPLALASSQPVTPQQVVEAGLIVREHGSATRDAAERHLQALGVDAKVVLELGSNQAVKQAAVAGGGVGVISRMGVTAEVKAEMLVVLDVEGWDCRRPLTLVHPKDRYLSSAQRAFREFLMDHRVAP